MTIENSQVALQSWVVFKQSTCSLFIMRLHAPILIPLVLIMSQFNAAQASTEVVVAHFGGTYGPNQNSALRNVVELQVGDFNGNGQANDTRTYLEIGLDRPFFLQLPELDARNNRISGGGQIVNFGSSLFPDFRLLRFNGTERTLQVTNDYGTAEMGMMFAFFVRKDEYLNQADQIEDLRFANREDGFSGTFRFTGVVNTDDEQSPLGLRRARLLVNSAGQWYVSQTTVGGSSSAISLNPAEEMWHEYDPDVLMFVYEVENGGNEPLTPMVRGDQLVDIQAVGVLTQNTHFDGREFNTHRFGVEAFQVYLDSDPDPVVDPDQCSTIFAGEMIDGFKRNLLGLVSDQHYPFVFIAASGWWHFHACAERGDTLEDGVYFYDLSRQAFGFHQSHWGEFVYLYGHGFTRVSE